METETLRVDPHEINLWEFLSELRSFYDYPLTKDVKLRWNYAADLPPVECDHGKLKRILENLIDNAIKFTEQGTVNIAARYLMGRKSLEFTISDTGVGIPREEISTIFERFHQVPGVNPRPEHSGVGLGLYIVKKYVDLLGGKIDVESRPDAGSTFKLAIPAPLAHVAGSHEQLLLSTAQAHLGADSR